jgi:hypothetical protein
MLSNTRLQGTRIALNQWVDAMQLACATPGGVTSRELAGGLGITRKSATLLLARLHAGRSAEPLRSLWRRALRRQVDAKSPPALAAQRKQAKVLLETLQRTSGASTPHPAQWKRASGHPEFRVTFWPLSLPEALPAFLLTGRDSTL